MNVVIGWPERHYLALSLTGLGYIAAKHGQPSGPHDIWAALISVVVVWSLLYWGGFFS